MCVGSIVRLTETWNDGEIRLAHIEGDGRVVPLLYIPQAAAGDYVLMHLGVAVEVLNPNEAHDALALRAEGEPS